MTTRINCSYVFRWRQFPSDRSTLSHHDIYSSSFGSYQKLFPFFPWTLSHVKNKASIFFLTKFMFPQTMTNNYTKLNLKTYCNSCDTSTPNIQADQKWTIFFLFSYFMEAFNWKRKKVHLFMNVSSNKNCLLKCLLIWMN